MNMFIVMGKKYLWIRKTDICSVFTVNSNQRNVSRVEITLSRVEKRLTDKCAILFHIWNQSSQKVHKNTFNKI